MIATLLLASCGGGGSSGPSPITSTDTVAPVAVLTFPAANALTNTNMLTVTGTASDSSTITVVRVNGVDATTTDGFSTWSANVPLIAGTNTLTVETSDIALNDDTAAAQINVNDNAVVVAPYGITVDAANNRAFVVDTVLNAILSINTNTEEPSILSDASNGSGPGIANPYDVAFDAPNNRLLVSEGASGSPAVLAVDLATGNRTILSDNGTGSGPALVDPRVMIIGGIGNKAFLIDSAQNDIVSVDLATSDRAILSGGGTGTGPFGFPKGLAFDNANARLLAVDSGLNAVLAIDPTNGNRTIVSDSGTGAGPTFSIPADIAIDSNNNQAIVADIDLKALIAVDLTIWKSHHFIQRFQGERAIVH